MSSDREPLVLVFMPSLVSVLLRAERTKGAPLTRSEVLSIRDSAVCVAVPISGVAAVVDARGYDDIDPENCWEQWSKARLELIGE